MKIIKGDTTPCSLNEFRRTAIWMEYTWGIIGHIIWYFKQLLPLTYRTTYTDTKTKERHFTVWNMWFGRCYNIDDYVIGKNILKATDRD